MPALPHLPPEIVSDLVLRALRLEARICDISAVSNTWHSIVVRHLAEVLILRDNGNMAPRHAALADCQDGQALVAASGRGHIEVVRQLLDAAQHAALADCRQGRALMLASYNGHCETAKMEKH
eukprot:gene26189-biopygen20663